MFAALASGSGKTTVTCAFLRAMTRRGLAPAAFKAGPDYIDPMFHRQVLGVPSYNLDLFFSDEEQIRALLAAHSAGRSPAVLEGAMGYYDGLGGCTDTASAWHLARATDTPVVLVLRPGSSSLTLAAQVKGLLAFRTPCQIRGLLLNGCSPMLAQTLAPALIRETGLPVFGCLPKVEGADFSSRHLGLVTAEEIPELQAKLDKLADALEQSADLDRLLALAESAPPLPAAPLPGEALAPVPCRIAVARDEAFCFYYDDTLELFRRLGAELCFFSPLRDTALPDGCGGLYLGGGYPELHTQALAENHAMRQAVQANVRAGLPTLAECGGFLYLQQTLNDPEGRAWPMAGVLEGRGFGTGKLGRFGYVTLTANRPTLLLRPGEALPAHEFHYWDCTENGDALTAKKPVGRRSWPCVVADGNLFAGFPHLYLPARPECALRFCQAAARRRVGR